MAQHRKLSPDEAAAIHRVIVVTVVLSLIGCSYIIVHHIRLRLRQVASPTATQTMITTLSVMDALFALPKVFGIPDKDNHWACNIQGFAISVTATMAVIWNMCIAHSMYRKVVCRESEATLQRRLPLYAAVTVLPSVAGGVAEWAADMFGEATFYCWVEDTDYHLLALYLWVIFGMVYVSAVLIITQRHILKQAQIHGNVEALESSAAISHKLHLYILVFVVMWLPATVFRVFGAYIGSSTFTWGVLMQLTLCAHGLVTGIIYGGMLSRQFRLCRCEKQSPRLNRWYQAMSPSSYPSHRGTMPILQGSRQTLSIFTSTFNLGEGTVSSDEMEKWIPRGYDLYVIGVQECQNLTELRQQMRRHIEGHGHLATRRSRLVRYAQYAREIGSSNKSLGYHGYIGITVFVRLQDVNSGAFFMPSTSHQEVNCGKSLFFGQRASNKGAVGFGFRYFDTSFAVVACHLASDLKGKSNVEKRNRDAASVLQSLQLNVDDLGFEFPLMHHHTFVMGDLNYRLNQMGATPDDVLQLLSVARRTSREEPLPSASASDARSLSSRSRRTTKKRSWLPSPFNSGTSDLSGGAATTTTVASGSAHRGSNLLGGFNSEQQQRTGSLSNSSDAAGKPSMELPLRLTSTDSHDGGRLTMDSALLMAGSAWDDLLLHDELRALMGSRQVFTGFEEARIEFPPTFRRVKERALPRRDLTGRSRHALSSEELAAFYTTVVDGRGRRVPSYTDRILYCSLPGMRQRLQCAQYTSVEEVTCSDHKPVNAVFHAAIDRESRPLLALNELESRPRMQDVAGVLECTLRVTCLSVTWMDNWTTNTTASSHHGSMKAVAVFPLPSEDVFSEQRRLHELEAMMRGGFYDASGRRRGSLTGNETGASTDHGHGHASAKTNGKAHGSGSTTGGGSSGRWRRGSSGEEAATTNSSNGRRHEAGPQHGNSVSVCYHEFQRVGLVLTTLARPTSVMHVALQLVAGDGAAAKCVGQGVLVLPRAFLTGQCPADGGNGQGTQGGSGGGLPFTMPLAVGGQRRATLEGVVSLSMAHPRSSETPC